MRTKSFIRLALSSTIVFALSAEAAPGGSSKMKEAKKPLRIFTLTYAGGPQWLADQPMEKQDLAGHLGWVRKLAESGTLLANGHLATGEGFYLIQAASFEQAESIAGTDPGLARGVLRLVSIAPWTMLMENLGLDLSGRHTFVVDVLPGPAFDERKPLAEQDLGPHLRYVGTTFESGNLILAGPVDAHHGRYVFAGADHAAAEAWTKADPAVQAGILRPQITEWTVFNHQAPRHAGP
jgi:uncharacterized protein YciI